VKPNIYSGRGTSMAAPQVSGAAALYRAQRQSATALETRAAILLTVDEVLPQVAYSQTNWHQIPDGQHSYRHRTTYGVGFLRDDLLAEYALRTPSIQPIGRLVTLSAPAPQDVHDEPYTGLA